MLDETTNNFKGLCSCRLSLVAGEPVQPMQDSFDLILSKNFLYEFLCVSLSKSIASEGTRLT